MSVPKDWNYWFLV